MPTDSPPLIDTVRALLRKGDWPAAAEAARRLVELDGSAEAYELLGLAGWWLSDIDTVFEAREHAYRLYLDRNDVRRAARIATWLDWDYRGFRGEPAVANGWLRRARRLLEGHHDSAEYGWLLLREADARLSQDAVAAAAGAAEAVALGRKHHNPNLEQFARAVEGLALVTAGQVTEGMQKLDDATAAVVAGEFTDRSVAGATCCYLITACELVRDYDRADQWCGRVKEYCEKWDHPPLFAVCRSQYAGVLLSSGDWTAAERELASAVKELGVYRPGWVSRGQLGLAELRQHQGRLDEATEMFEAIAAAPQARLGLVATQARLGLAAIALERGVPAEAERLARVVLRQVSRNNHTARAAALEMIVLAAAAGNRAELVRAELGELEQLAAAVESEAIRASARLAAGAFLFSIGERAQGRTAIEEAAAGFDRAGVPYDWLRARLLLAEQLQTGGDLAGAAAEAADVAREAKRLGARTLEQRATALGLSLDPKSHRRAALTARESQVLALVAQGLTNRQIGGRLGVSQHTIHRHLGNVFTRLGLSSRAAAVAFALRNGIG